MTLTVKTRRVAARFTPLATAMETLCAGYGDDELDVVIDFLTKLDAVMDDQIQRLRT